MEKAPVLNEYGRVVIPLKERQAIQLVEGKSAMADYKQAEQHSRDNLAKLRAERFEREMAVNNITSDNARRLGSVRVTGLEGKLRGEATFKKRDKTNGRA